VEECTALKKVILRSLREEFSQFSCATYIGRCQECAIELEKKSTSQSACMVLVRELPEPGHTYLAPDPHHMITDLPKITYNKRGNENRSRPAINPLFRSVAAFGGGTYRDLLNYIFDDGIDGLKVIKERNLYSKGSLKMPLS
jgi:chemotaxis response regulator CheB